MLIALVIRVLPNVYASNPVGGRESATDGAEL
jgi:hypothetical protein